MNQRLFNELIKEEKQHVLGEKSNDLEKSRRVIEFPLKWKLSNVVTPYLQNDEQLLLMGNDVKEEVEAVKHLSKVTVESEGTVCYNDDSFDVVLNKHELVDAKEISRLLMEDGYFITEQVGGLNNCELNLWLNLEATEASTPSLRRTVNQLKEAGLTILEAKDDISLTRFYDVGAIVYYLKVNHWQFPNFTVEKYFDRLVAIQAIIEQQGYMDITRHRFLIVAQKIVLNEN